ncbi:hypothetical protein [Nocardioides xinjiangensis]|uniref:hypothetical protein n=1 Tax=Nocardioides xinjiangensis TaxID=2817376 RepID=UPI001B31643C|nr:MULTISPECIES: hypothetical protein [unclassified Nocardioides]
MARPQDHRHDVVERFRPTSGRLTGWLAVVLGALLVVAGLVYLDDGFPPWIAAAGLLLAVLAWASMLRPALWATEEHLVMRNLAETVHIRLAAIEETAIGQVLAVRAADRRHVSPVVGRTWRKALVSRRGGAGTAEEGPREGMPYVDWVEHRLRELVERAQRDAGVRPGSAEQLALPDAVRRERAVVPRALIAVAVVALLVSLFL